MDVGIVGYGTQIPRYRIKVEEIAKVWGADAPSYKKGLNLNEKSVPNPDEDVATLTVNAARNTLLRAGINPMEIGAVYVGSESHPYAVKPTGTILAEALGICPHVHTADFEFACKAGTSSFESFSPVAGEILVVSLSFLGSAAFTFGADFGFENSAIRLAKYPLL